MDMGHRLAGLVFKQLRRKQEAADAATDAWWAAVATPILRDVDLEIDVLLPRVLVVPPPNYLYGETGEYLRKLMQGLRRQYEEEMGAETRRGKLRIQWLTSPPSCSGAGKLGSLSPCTNTLRG